MNQERTLWTIVLLLGVVGLVVCAVRGTGKSFVLVNSQTYVEFDGPGDAESVWISEADAEALAEAEANGFSRTQHEPVTIASQAPADPRQKDDPNVEFSLANTIGVWIAGLLTLFVLSFLWGDNPLYKIAESLVIGTSAAYTMVAAFWPMLIENLLGNLVPNLIRAWSNPGLDQVGTDIVYIVPLILCVMLLWRLSPSGGWIARWPLAFFIGATAGFRLMSHLESDFILQIEPAIGPLIALGSGDEFQLWGTIGALIMFLGVLSTLIYFFFSVEHKGAVGQTARVGIWFLMITFGVGFGTTVMGRIALIASRFEFLVDDWLWLIDPTSKRVAMLLFM
ncbi:MAG: hypothetical protein ACR2GY_07295 [Phycisphaerales bacterium]